MNNENFDLELNNDVENFNLAPNDEDEEFTVEFGEIFNDGGTHDYDELDNKPQINGNTLEGNKTGEQLGLQDKINDLDTIRSGAAKGATAVQPHNLARVATTGSYTDLNNKPTIPTVNDGTLTIQRNGNTVASFTANSNVNRTANISVPTATSQLVNDSGYTTNTGTITGVKMNGRTVATTGEANLGTVITDVSEKQNITDNSLETSNKTVPGAINELKRIVPVKDNYTITNNSNNQIQTVGIIDQNVGGIIKYWEGTQAQYDAIETKDNNTIYYITDSEDIYVTKTVNDLVNYYTKTQTFTKQEVNDLISAITTMDIQVVQTLPTEDISTTTIYFVPKATAETNDIYDEYIYVSNAWEHIGSTEVDLTNYVQKTDYATNSTGGVFKVSSTYGLAMSQQGILYGAGRTYAQYQSAGANLIVAKGTLENVITGKGLVSNTDFADSNTGGVIRVGSSYGTSTSSSGNLIASVKTYEDYSSAGNYMLIGKGTLENVITGKSLVSAWYGTQAQYDALSQINPDTLYCIVES